MTTNNRRELTPAEAHVIERKGTERPFTGKFYAHASEGIYTCRRCGAALYRSTDKFDAGCGWPAFDDEVAGAVRREIDADGERTEILCARCDGHLGHLFVGEHFTPRNTRHCANSIALDFVAEAELTQHFRRATFAGGCFWGVEYFLQQAGGVIRAVSGYIGGATENPTYEQVCGGETGHYEAVEVLFDPRRTNYELLTKLFFNTHDPTQVDGQGPDVGTQYRSAIFYHDEAQHKLAAELIAQLQAQGLKVATRLLPAATFYAAEVFHQDYYFRKGTQPYCHRFVKRL